MYSYKNVKTGAVIAVPCHVSGDWVLIEDKTEEKPKPKAKPKKEKK